MRIFILKIFCLSYLSVALLPIAVFSKENPPAEAPAAASKALRYTSPHNQNTLELKFKEFFKGRGFVYRRDQDIRRGAVRRLRFDKDNLSIDVNLLARGDKGTEVLFSAYDHTKSVLDAKKVSELAKTRSIELPDYSQSLKDPGIVSFSPAPAGPREYYALSEMPICPDSRLLSEPVPKALVGKGGIGQVYESDKSAKEVEYFYRAALKKLGFREEKGKNFKISEFKRVRFESNNAAVELYLYPRGDNACNFILVRYPAKDGVSSVEADPLAGVSFSEEDNPNGSDLENIPRPGGSVRLSGGEGRDINMVKYTLPMTVREAKDFYIKEMPAYGWKLDVGVDIGKADEEYAKEHKGLKVVPKIPLGAKMDLGEVIRDSYGLYFSSAAGSVSIAIFPNFLDPAAGSIADISYYPKRGS